MDFLTPCHISQDLVPTSPRLRKINSRRGKKRKHKTYNTRDSPVVTHPSTSLAIVCLSMGERTGSRVLRHLWSYVTVHAREALIYPSDILVGKMNRISNVPLFHTYIDDPYQRQLWHWRLNDPSVAYLAKMNPHFNCHNHLEEVRPFAWNAQPSSVSSLWKSGM